MMDELPAELSAFALLLDAQPSPVRQVFHYCLCLMMVEAGKMELVETLPGDATPFCVFQTTAGETFSVPRPSISPEEEATLVATLRTLLEEDGLL